MSQMLSSLSVSSKSSLAAPPVDHASDDSSAEQLLSNEFTHVNVDETSAELEALAEGQASQYEQQVNVNGIAARDIPPSSVSASSSPPDDSNTHSTRTVDPDAHPRITVHGVHGLDPSQCTRAEIEAKLEEMDQARKAEKRRLEAISNGIVWTEQEQKREEQPPDESILKVLALRKLQLLQLHLKTDNLPILIRSATSTHGNLYLGSVGASHHLPNLLSHKMTHILSVGRGLTQPFPTHFQYLYIPMLDSSTTKITEDIYHATWKFIEQARTGREVDIDETFTIKNSPTSSDSSSSSSTAASSSPQLGNVMIHCFAGKSRSTTMLISYLMYSERWSLNQAFCHVKKCRPAINPNPGFLLQLKQLEQKLFPSSSPKNSTVGANA